MYECLKGGHMPISILVGYATNYGSTQEVAENIAVTLREHGFLVDVQPLREVRTLAEYRAVVVGAPLFMFHWHKDAVRFLARYREALVERPVAVFALGPVRSPHDEKEWQDARARLTKDLDRFPWFKPITCEVFGGRLDPASLHFPFKMFARKMQASDLRDWATIHTWTEELATRLASLLLR